MDYWFCVSVCLHVSVFSRERYNVQMLRASLSETPGVMDFTSVWNQEPRIQKFEEDCSERDGAACKEGEIGLIDVWDSFVGKEELYFRDGLHLCGKGLPFLPRDCQWRLPVAWVKYDI